jgi:YGGT family
MSNQPYSPDPRMQGYQHFPNQVPDKGQEYDPAAETVKSINSGGAYLQSQHESYVDPMGNRIENREEVVEDENLRRANTRYWITRITYFLLGVLEILLLLRFIFRLFGANQDNGFIMFLYNLSHVFVAAFNGIFNDQTLGRNGVFEVSTLIAMIIYALLAWGIVSLGRVLFAPNLSAHQSITTRRRSRY